MTSYKVPAQTRLQFAALFVLSQIVENELDFETLIEDEETALTPILEWLFDILALCNTRFFQTNEELTRQRNFIGYQQLGCGFGAPI